MEEQPAVDPPQNLQRQARKQVPGPVTSERSDDQVGSVNIWSGRRVGPRGPEGGKGEKRARQPSKYRCHPVTDTGKTRGSEGQINQFCLFFAKGMCYQGYACTYLHRLPTSADNAAMTRTTSQDIFGREKLPDNLDNRKGAGSYDRDMTTLYVNYGGAGHYATPQLRHLLLENFGVFGPIKSVYIVPSKTIAFVKFHWRVSAEFAKEAMDSQTLSGSTMHEVLSVRWSNDDPNPVAVVGRKREALDAAEAAALAVWDAMPPEEKRARLAMMHQARAKKVSAVADRMPEQLLHASDSDMQAGSSRQQFDEWRGIPGQQPEAAAAAEAGRADAGEDAGEQGAAHTQQQLEQQEQLAGGYYADPQAYAAQWQEYHYQQQQQQQHGADWGSYQASDTTADGAGGPGSWYQGWRQRHKPNAAITPTESSQQAAAAATSSAGDATAGPAAAAAADAGAGALGLLAGYGSGSDAEDEGDADDKKQQLSQQREQEQQQQQRQPSEAHGQPQKQCTDNHASEQHDQPP